MISAFCEIDEGRALHSFFEMDDGSCLAFFEVPRKPFEFKRQDTLDLHIALGVEPDVFDRMLEKGGTEGVEVRGPVDHGFCRSIYMRDPNGYVIELTASFNRKSWIRRSRSRARHSRGGRRRNPASQAPAPDNSAGYGAAGVWDHDGTRSTRVGVAYRFE